MNSKAAMGTFVWRDFILSLKESALFLFLEVVFSHRKAPLEGSVFFYINVYLSKK
jgi:hypothetical protein